MDWTLIITNVVSAVIVIIPAYFIFRKECNSVKKECENLSSILRTAENLVDKGYKHQIKMGKLILDRYKSIGK